MANYSNFQSDNAKYGLSNRNNYNPALNPTVNAKGMDQATTFEKNLDKYIQLASWIRYYPDLFLDMISPQKGALKLHSDQRIYLRCIVRFVSLYGVFPRGYGKCIAGDSLLFTEDGMKELGSYFNYQDNDVETFTPTKVKMINRYGKLEPTAAGVYSGYKDTKIIKTEEGFEIENSLNHPILVMNKDGNIDWKKSEDVCIGDYVIINRKNDVWGSNVQLKFNMNNYLDSLSNQSQSHIIKCNTPDILTEDLALIIGYLIGDGMLTQENTVAFTSKDDDMILNYKNYINNIIGLPVKNYTDIDYIINSKYFREYLYQIGLKYSNAFEKEVPSCILEAPKNIVSKFIQGLFDTDGGISNSYIEYCTASEKMSKQVQTMLLNFGIISTRKIKYNKKFKTNSYTIKIYGSNMDLYKTEIGFSCKRKQDKLEIWCAKKRNPNKDIIPYQTDSINKFYKYIKKDNTYVYDNIYHILKGKNGLTYNKLDYLLSLKNSNKCDEYPKLKELQDLGYFYSKVESVENSKNHVYDLTLLETHSFISNGFVSHNTFNEVLAMFLIAISHPGIELAMTAQTKENAAELLKDKYMEIIKYYPMLKNEVIETKFSKNDAEITFVNNSRVDILANSNSSKGQRRKRINIEEAALLDNETFMDALQPIVEVPRSTVGTLAVVDPEELNQQINFFTTSGFRGSDEFARSLRMIGGMVDLTGEMILGSDWHLACWYGRGSTKAQIKKKKETMSPISFAQNYMSRWVGASDNALVDINKLLKLRVLTSPKLKADKDGEYYLGVDVARSQATSNNQTSVSVLEVKRNKNNKITQIMLVNMFTISNSLNFTQQALRVKQIRKDFNAKVVCVDTNGLGVGLLDELLKESFDPYTGESYGCWDTLNTDVNPEIKGSEKVIYDLKPQSANSDIIVSFIDMVESGKLKLLEKVTENQVNVPDEKAAEMFAPYKQTDLLVEEIANLRLKHLPSGKLTIEKVIKRYDKDRFSSLIYALWYIKTFEENIYEQIDDWSSYVISGSGGSAW